MPNGLITDVAVDVPRLLESPPLADPLLKALCDLVSEADFEYAVGASPAGAVIASQIAMRLNRKLYQLGYDLGPELVDLGAALQGERVAIFDTVLFSPQQFDRTISILRARGAVPCLIGTLGVLPTRQLDLPVEAVGVVKLQARLFEPGHGPPEVATLPVEPFPIW